MLTQPPSLAWQQSLQLAQQAAQQARFDDLLRIVDEIASAHSEDGNALMQVGALLQGAGFLTRAKEHLESVRALRPNDARPIGQLASVASDMGNHDKAVRLYRFLLQHLPDHAIIRRNMLTGMQYAPQVTAQERLQQARDWGQWAMARAGGPRERPRLLWDGSRPLRVGYVSADFCHHTVGLFVKDVIAQHHPNRVTAYAYSAGRVNDWVTDAIRSASQFRDVSDIDDTALTNLIRDDGIDVLVDLSGHTAGSRLTAFAHRPAPVQMSWLGYFATTGLSVIDAALLDDWHAPAGLEEQFVEPIVRLPHGRFCYVPMPFAPAQVAPPPCETNGFVTFGCFNNTAKLNPQVISLWAQILTAVPTSRLVLKWRTFQDEALRASVIRAFADHGITTDRIELRGASIHGDVLKQYADIDIALDPFPFTGGLTSCEALWMGVPVVTWPHEQVVSRQTYAFLGAIGLLELAASDAGDYVRIAVALANDRGRLRALRTTMRDRMRASPLCDVDGFVTRLEDAMWQVASSVAFN